MSLAEHLQPGFIPIYLGALGQLAVGATVWAVGRKDLRMRFFAVLLSANAFWDLGDFVGGSISVSGAMEGWTAVNIIAASASIYAAVAFAVTYPRRLPIVGSNAMLAAYGALVATAVILTFALYEPTLLQPASGRGYDLLTHGATWSLSMWWFPALAVIALRAIRVAAEVPAARILALGALVYPSFAIGNVMLGQRPWPPALDTQSWTTVSSGLMLYVNTLVNWAVIPVIVYVFYRAARLATSRERKAIVGLFILLTMASIVTTISFQPGAPDWLWPGAGLGVYAGAFAGINGYALLRHKLFDIDLKLKFGIRQSTIASVFIAAFFIVSELTAQVVGDTGAGPTLGILAAGGLVFALAPLQRFADGVANRAMPNVRPDEDFLHGRKLEVYAATVRSAYEDGQVTKAERIMMATLADELGLTPKEALEAERPFLT